MICAACQSGRHLHDMWGPNAPEVASGERRVGDDAGCPYAVPGAPRGRCQCRYVRHVNQAPRMVDTERAAVMLEKWAELRLGYLHREEPTTANEIEALSHHDLLIWAEAEGVRHAAKILRDPRSTMSIPTWLEHLWETHLDTYFHAPATLRAYADSCGVCGHFWDWHGKRKDGIDDGACNGAYVAGTGAVPCDCRAERGK